MIQFNKPYEYVGKHYDQGDTAQLPPKLEQRLIAMGIAREPDPEPEIEVEIEQVADDGIDLVAAEDWPVDSHATQASSDSPADGA